MKYISYYRGLKMFKFVNAIKSAASVYNLEVKINNAGCKYTTIQELRVVIDTTVISFYYLKKTRCRASITIGGKSYFYNFNYSKNVAQLKWKGLLNQKGKEFMAFFISKLA